MNKFAPKPQHTTHAKDTFKKPPISRITLNIDPNIHHRLKIQAAQDGRTMRDVIEHLLTTHYLN